MSKALIVFGTRYGATASTSEEIAKTMFQKGFKVDLSDAKKEKIKSITDYDLIVVGSGIQINRWTSKPEDFLKEISEATCN